MFRSSGFGGLGLGGFRVEVFPNYLPVGLLQWWRGDMEVYQKGVLILRVIVIVFWALCWGPPI